MASWHTKLRHALSWLRKARQRSYDSHMHSLLGRMDLLSEFVKSAAVSGVVFFARRSFEQLPKVAGHPVDQLTNSLLTNALDATKLGVNSLNSKYALEF